MAPPPLFCFPTTFRQILLNVSVFLFKRNTQGLLYIRYLSSLVFKSPRLVTVFNFFLSSYFFFLFSLVRFLCLDGDDLELYIERCVRSPIRFVGRLCSEFTRTANEATECGVPKRTKYTSGLEDEALSIYIYIIYNIVYLYNRV